MQKRKQHPVIAAGILVAIVAVIAFTFAVWKFGWDWTGFTAGASKITITHAPTGTTTATELQPARTLWDWLGLLAALAIPIVVGFGVAWFTTQQGKVSDEENRDNQREAALQAYLDRLSELLMKEGLRTSKPEDEVRSVARVRTLTILHQLDEFRKAVVIQFLYESDLIRTGVDKCIIDLTGADLNQADFFRPNRADLSGICLIGAELNFAVLSFADLNEADLSEALLISAEFIETDLSNAALYDANLAYADLSEADLSEADLRKAFLGRANLSDTNLSGAKFNEADLSEAKLIRANLERANLSGANFSKANLKGATGITIEELETKAKSLKGATMPNGSKHS